jgi:hypothetical protein
LNSFVGYQQDLVILFDLFSVIRQGTAIAVVMIRSRQAQMRINQPSRSCETNAEIVAVPDLRTLQRSVFPELDRNTTTAMRTADTSEEERSP